MSRLRDSRGVSEETSPWGCDPEVRSRWLRLGQVGLCWGAVGRAGSLWAGEVQERIRRSLRARSEPHFTAIMNGLSGQFLKSLDPGKVSFCLVLPPIKS